MRIKETLNLKGLNRCSGLAAASLLNLSLGSVALGSLSCISPSFFSLHFPLQSLFVVGENCASMRSKAFSVKWPMFKCSRGVLSNCSNKLLLIWRCGVVSPLIRRFIHLAKRLHGKALNGRFGQSYDFVFCQSIWGLPVRGHGSNMSTTSNADLFHYSMLNANSRLWMFLCQPSCSCQQFKSVPIFAAVSYYFIMRLKQPTITHPHPFSTGWSVH